MQHRLRHVYTRELRYITKILKVQDLADAAERAFKIIGRHHINCSFFVYDVFVEGGIDDKLCGYVSFHGGRYQYEGSEKTWLDCLAEDLKEQQEKIHNSLKTWSLQGIMFIILAQGKPIVLTLEREDLMVVLGYSEYDAPTELSVIQDLREEFGGDEI